MIKTAKAVRGVTIRLRALVMLLLVFGLSGTSQAVVELTLWDWFEPRVTLTQKYLDQYMELNPDVHIKMELLPDMVERLAIALSTGTAPELIQIHDSWIGAFADGFETYPESLFPRAQLQSDYLLFDMTSTVNGRVYYLPVGIMGSAIYYNVNMLESSGYDAVPTDWESFIEAARRLRVIDGSGVMSRAGFMPVQNLGLVWQEVIYQIGGRLFNEEGTGVDFTAPHYADAARIILPIMTSNVGEPGLAFANGNVAMEYQWTWYTSRARRLDFAWGMSIIPSPDGDSYPARGRNAIEVGIGVPKDIPAEKKEAAFRFIKWLFDNDDYIVELSLSLGIAPSRTELWGRADVAEALPTLLQQVPYTVFPGPLVDWFYVLMDTGLQRIADGESITAVLENMQIEGMARYAEEPIPIKEGEYLAPAR